jgi:hypothetical protein
VKVHPVFGLDFGIPGTDRTVIGIFARDAVRREYAAHEEPIHKENASDLMIDMVKNEEGKYVPNIITYKRKIS